MSRNWHGICSIIYWVVFYGIYRRVMKPFKFQRRWLAALLCILVLVIGTVSLAFATEDGNEGDDEGPVVPCLHVH